VLLQILLSLWISIPTLKATRLLLIALAIDPLVIDRNFLALAINHGVIGRNFLIDHLRLGSIL
jgi:hypothetical protein